MEKATCPRCGAEVKLIDGWNLCPMCAMLVENEADSHLKNQKKFYGEEEYRRIQKMNGRQK